MPSSVTVSHPPRQSPQHSPRLSRQSTVYESEHEAADVTEPTVQHSTGDGNYIFAKVLHFLRNSTYFQFMQSIFMIQNSSES